MDRVDPDALLGVLHGAVRSPYLSVSGSSSRQSLPISFQKVVEPACVAMLSNLLFGVAVVLSHESSHYFSAPHECSSVASTAQVGQGEEPRGSR